MKKTGRLTRDRLIDVLGNRLRAARKSQGKTLCVLAEEAHLSVSLISQVERAESAPSLASLIKIAGALEVSLEELFHGF